MEHQQAHFDQSSFDESTSYSTGYEEAAGSKDSFTDSSGQKLSPRDGLMSPTAGQRLLLAIVSLLLLFLIFLTVVILVTTGALAPTHIVPSIAAVLVVMVLGFFAAVVVINVVFNRRR